jgi:hypothetical protein
VFFFLGFLVLLNRVLNGAWCFSDHRFDNRFLSNRGRRCLDHFGDRSSSGCQFGFLLQTLFFTLATTHFTRVVWRAAARGQGADRSRCFNHWGWRFGNYWRFNRRRFNHLSFNDWRWSRFGSHNHWLGNHGLRDFGFSNRGWCFGHSWLGNPVESGLLFANFTHGFGHGFSDGFNNRLGNHERRWFYLRQGFLNRCHFDFRSSNHFYRSSRFNNRRFHFRSFLNGRGGAFSLLVGLGFRRSTDHGAGNGCGHSEAGGQIGSAWLFSVFAGFGFFRTFDHVAVGITLTLTTVAATTLAAGTTTWTIAFGAS